MTIYGEIYQFLIDFARVKSFSGEIDTFLIRFRPDYLIIKILNLLKIKYYQLKINLLYLYRFVGFLRGSALNSYSASILFDTTSQ